MTRSPAPDAAYEHRSFGSPGADRVVVILRAGVSALSDPRPDLTARRDARIVAVGLTLDDIDDPAAYRGTTPAEAAAVAISRFVSEQRHDRPVGLVGVGIAGELAVLVAADLGDDVDRLALVAVPQPESELGGTEVARLLARIQAQTLIANGEGDPAASLAAARWFQARLPSARIEMIRETTADPEKRLVLADAWEQVLGHVAPGAVR